MDISIRTWDVEDAMALWRLSMHPFYVRRKLWKYLYPDTFLHAVSTIQFYQSANRNKYLFRAVTYKNKVCGYIESTKRTSSACELAYWLGVEYWHQGIMKQAVARMCDEVFHTMDVLCIYARVDKNNIASKKILEYNGFISYEYKDFIIYKKYK